jgi:predicted ATPase
MSLLYHVLIFRTYVSGVSWLPWDISLAVFVGRERERAELVGRLTARGTVGSATIVIGEAGIGKSTLVESVLDGPAIRGRCSPEEGTPPFWPWQTMVPPDRLDPPDTPGGGNPLYLRELTRCLADDGHLAEPARETPLPAELRRLAALRMDGVGAGCRRLIGAASVLGDEVDLTLLRAVAAPDDLAAVAEAVAAGVLVDDPATPNRLCFNHTLVRQAHYDLAAREDRLAWHAAVAAATTDLAERARHLVRTAVDDAHRRMALEACRAAAADAEHRLAFETAAYWYGQARSLGADDALTAALLLAEAEADFRAARSSTALDLATAACDIAERLGRADLAARAALAVHDIGWAPANQAIAGLCARALQLLDEPSRCTPGCSRSTRWSCPSCPTPTGPDPSPTARSSWPKASVRTRPTAPAR